MVDRFEGRLPVGHRLVQFLAFLQGVIMRGGRFHRGFDQFPTIEINLGQM